MRRDSLSPLPPLRDSRHHSILRSTEIPCTFARWGFGMATDGLHDSPLKGAIQKPRPSVQLLDEDFLIVGDTGPRPQHRLERPAINGVSGAAG
mmetsp:Transcript_74173/g.197816  ORF Transcript_74173/g.197816 Transcript_74173/m.197816 type:complete len:93 (+) Transcript_74173:713-991(+)